jgi:hypothetical protein
MNCPRCGRAQPPDAQSGVFCVHCGQFLVPTKWVATSPAPPRGAPPPAQPRARYTGPPRYPSPPTWGFPALPWHREKPASVSAPETAAAGHAGLLIPLLRGLAVLALVASAAEIWRYVLLLGSRTAALDAGQVAASDALVQAASWVCTLMAVVVGAYLLFWVFLVIRAAAARSGVRPSRGRGAVLLGWLVPGLNLSVPGAVLAEVEHAALGRPPNQRPRPSRLLLVWWLLWAGNVVFGVLAVIWLLRSGVQAKADGVLLHAAVDLLAAATAVVTARVVAWLTALVNPPRSIRLPTVVSVRDKAQRATRGGLADRLRTAAATVVPR